MPLNQRKPGNLSELVSIVLGSVPNLLVNWAKGVIDVVVPLQYTDGTMYLHGKYIRLEDGKTVRFILRWKLEKPEPWQGIYPLGV